MQPNLILLRAAILSWEVEEREKNREGGEQKKIIIKRVVIIKDIGK